MKPEERLCCGCTGCQSWNNEEILRKKAEAEKRDAQARAGRVAAQQVAAAQQKIQGAQQGGRTEAAFNQPSGYKPPSLLLPTSEPQRPASQPIVRPEPSPEPSPGPGTPPQQQPRWGPASAAPAP